MENQHTSSRDFFLYLLSIITLFASVIALNVLVFAYIDIGFPSALETYTYFNTQIKSSMATLLVMFPVYISVVWFLRKDLVKNPEKRELGVRKFLIHLTLFVAAIVIIVDLITLINTFLNGDLTTRFVLKVVTVLVTTGSVFAYYIWDLRRSEDSAPSRVVAITAALVVLSSIVGGFFLIGSPSTQRKYRFDERRVQDLESIHYQVINFYQLKKRLPDELKELANDVNGFNIPLDPDQNQMYVYNKTSDTAYELCATFSLVTGDDANKRVNFSRPFGLSWVHPVGKHCFKREVDKELRSL